MIFAMGIERKLLVDKDLRKTRPATLVLSPLLAML